MSPLPTRTKLFWVAVLYFAEGFPLGVFYDVLPVYFRTAGVDLSEIGVLSLLGLAWTLKFLWAPAVDHFRHHRRWMLAVDLLMGATLLYLAVHAGLGPGVWTAIALFTLFSATNDVAIDGYTIELLGKHELGIANGFRIGFYRVGMLAAGAVLIAADFIGWRGAFVLSAGLLAVLGLAAWRAPREPARSRAAVPVARELAALARRPWAVAAAAGLLLGAVWLADGPAGLSARAPALWPVLLALWAGLVLASGVYRRAHCAAGAPGVSGWPAAPAGPRGIPSLAGAGGPGAPAGPGTPPGGRKPVGAGVTDGPNGTSDGNPDGTGDTGMPAAPDSSGATDRTGALATPAEHRAADAPAGGPVFGALLELLSRRHVWALVLFVLLYKLADSAMGFMVKPFWVDVGFSSSQIGLVSVQIGLALSIVGGVLGGWFTDRRGIFTGLWVLGLAQAVSNLGYAWAAAVIPPGEVTAAHTALLYAVSALESFTGGLGTAAFLAFLMAVVDRRHSAAGYALLSSLFALTRSVAGWAGGLGAESWGYAPYFLLTFFLAFPAYLLLPWVKRILWDAERRPTVMGDARPGDRPTAG